MKKRNPQLLLLVGAPGSGKTTFAKYHLRTHLNWARVSRDDFRTMHFAQSFMPERGEEMITKMIDAAVEALLIAKTNVIADATHTKKEYLDVYIKKFGHLADISFKLFEPPTDVLIRRCRLRYEETGRFMPQSAIEKHQGLLAGLKKDFSFDTRIKQARVNSNREQDTTLPKAILCDLDGTLALLNGRDPYNASGCGADLLNTPVANVLRNYQQLGYRVILVSGREDTYKAPTLGFLEQHGIVYDQLLMRAAGDSRKDAIIKKELFRDAIADKYYVEFVLDDRDQVVQMWRDELKLPCFQVYYGDF
ncbi:AAA family ATPase [Taibaiella chishuiensis]|uniref:Putative acid phosphatase of HAD superfamily subfamily IIIB n=1 Tax=Taibaiella chishuiensis TaxID=1434707 RepID=A0A2P8DAT6_9BACT|nr:AAA family ATPase [Taibaiella chishuiensis]PSK94328.1 putative acid phosphatase of HAD superfamily subfamily IIIB [Taibaiella chishuiensis]